MPEIQKENQKWALGRQKRARNEEKAEYPALWHKENISAVPGGANAPHQDAWNATCL